MLAYVGMVGPMTHERDAMETVTAINAYQDYESVAKGMARNLCSTRHEIDSRAWAYDDHVQELRLHAIDIADIFQKTVGFCTPAEKRYVRKCLWNKTANWKRSDNRGRIAKSKFEVCTLLDDEYYEIAPHIEARQTVKRVMRHFSTEEQNILIRVMESGNKMREAWNPEIDGSFSTFSRRVSRLRARAKNLRDS